MNSTPSRWTSPLGKTPLLRVARREEPEAILFESNVICEYIEETRGDPRLHPSDPLERAQHRGWMEFGSAILSDLWSLETTQDPAIYAAKREAIGAKFARVEAVLGDGPYFAGENFSLVDAVFAPIFRYFDVFDTIIDTGVFAQTPKVRAWRAALSQHPSVRGAVGQDYPERLRASSPGTMPICSDSPREGVVMSQGAAWTALIVAGLLDVGWAVSMKYAEGYTRHGWSLTSLALLGAFVYLLGRALETLPVGTAYAVWTGIGAVGTVLMGVALFGESLNIVRLGGIALVLAGIVALKFAPT